MCRRPWGEQLLVPVSFDNDSEVPVAPLTGGCQSLQQGLPSGARGLFMVLRAMRDPTPPPPPHLQDRGGKRDHPPTPSVGI